MDDQAAHQTVRIGSVVLLPGDSEQSRREKLARVVLDGMYQFVGLLDAEGRILEINHTALNGAGERMENIRGRPFWEARWWSVSTEAREAQRRHVQRAARGEFVRCDMEIFGSASGHETIVVDFSLLPVRDQAGRVAFLLAEGRNITEKTRAQAELARKNDELEALLRRVQALDRLKTDFFANLSHELRTPLTLIIGCAETLLERKASNGDVALQRNLGVIRRNAAVQLSIVNDLLDMAKSDSGQLQLHYRRVDAASLVRQCVAQFDVEAERRDIMLVVDVPSRLHVDVDVTKFERVLQNLLSNAFRFSSDGARVRCSLAALTGDRLLLIVQDNGPGVPLAERRLIFERFQQGHLAAQGAGFGTGLGLTIVKEFVALHGGTVGVSDAPGGGAKFQVELPRFAPQDVYVERDAGDRRPYMRHNPVSAVTGEGEPAEGETVGEATVLVVDDHDELRGFVSEVLRPRYRVHTAGGGRDGLAAARRLHPDVIVTDLMMPDGGGETLVQAVRGDTELLSTPILILSARADDRLRAALLSHWVQDYLTKPFSPQELRARVQNLVTIKRTREALQCALSSKSQDLEQLTQELIAHRRALQRNVDTLQRSEQRWRVLFEHSPAGIVIVDRRNRIAAINDAFRRMVGGHSSARRGQPLVDLMTDELPDGLAHRLLQLADVCRAQPLGMLRLRHASGEVVECDAAMATLPMAGSPGPFVAVAAIDITQRVKAERSLAHLQDRMARNSRASTLGLMAASIAHEVSQPLAAILASAQACARWLAAEPAAVAQAAQACGRIVADTRRAWEVVDRTRAAIRDDGGCVADIMLSDLFAEALTLCRDSASSFGIEIELSVAPDLRAVRADRVRLQQVLLNLLLNAVEASRGLPAARSVVRLEAHGHDPGWVRLAVRDRGHGIAPEWRSLIFEPFHTSKPQGMGIGLALSRAVVERFGGRLWVEANLDFGETFNLTLPSAGPNLPLQVQHDYIGR